MALLAIQHTVRDYPVWQAVYDSLDEVRGDWGVTTASVHQLADAPNTVLVLLSSLVAVSGSQAPVDVLYVALPLYTAWKEPPPTGTTWCGSTSRNAAGPQWAPG